MLQLFKNDVFEVIFFLAQQVTFYAPLGSVHQTPQVVSSSLIVTSLSFLLLQNHPNFWFHPYM